MISYDRFCVLMPLGLVLLAAPSGMQAGVGTIRLELKPSSQTVFEVETISVSLFAISDDPSPDEISVMEVILTWDPAILTLQGNVDPAPAMGGYAWLTSAFPVVGDYGLNQSFADGDALYIARSQFFDPPGSALATSNGLWVTTFEFTAVSSSEGVDVIIPLTDAESGAESQVIGDIPNFDVLSGAMGATVSVESCDALFDTDGDSDIDLVDYDALQRCFSGSGQPAEPFCRCFLDTDADQDVDAFDAAQFVTAVTGPTP